MKWEDLSGRNEEMVYYLIVKQLEKGNIELIDNLYIYLLDEKFEISFDFFDSVDQSLSGIEIPDFTPNLHLLLMTSPILIPFTINFILTAAFSHYLLNMYSEFNRKFHEGKGLEEIEVKEAADAYIEKNPFDFYFITFSWDFYSKAFNERYQQLAEGEAKAMALAAFVVNAARVSLVAGVPCEGEEWEKTLKVAKKSPHPFVQISLTLYKLCNFIGREKNSGLLTSQLEKFKRDYPAYYKLIGFQED